MLPLETDNTINGILKRIENKTSYLSTKYSSNKFKRVLNVSASLTTSYTSKFKLLRRFINHLLFPVVKHWVFNLWSAVTKDWNSYIKGQSCMPKASSPEWCSLFALIYSTLTGIHMCVQCCQASHLFRSALPPFGFNWISACPLTVSPRRYISHQITERAHVKVSVTAEWMFATWLTVQGTETI